MTRTTQKNGLEKAKEKLKIMELIKTDTILFWHFATYADTWTE
jgi:hypothetical protein